MKYWIKIDGQYYEAETKQDVSDVEVVERPNKNITWNPDLSRWVPYKILEWNKLRRERTEKLQNSDFTQLPDSSFSTAEKEVWATYRQGLRDVPEKYIGPDWWVWPTEP